MSRADQVEQFKADRKRLLDNRAHRGPDNTVTYYFSNDERFYTVVFPLLQLSKVDNATDKMRVALVVGQSHLPSILPELQNCCDLLLVVDYHKPCLNWVKTMISQLGEQQTLPAYQQTLQRIHDRDAQIPERRATFPFFDERIQNEKIKLSEKHFTDRFPVVKKSAEELPVDYILMDLAREDKVQALQQLLTNNNAEISFLNISNIVDYASCAQVVRNVSLLPFSDNPLIVTSESKPMGILTPVCCQVFRSTEALQSKYLADSYVPH